MHGCFVSFVICFYSDILQQEIHKKNKLHVSHFFTEIPRFTQKSAKMLFPWNAIWKYSSYYTAFYLRFIALKTCSNNFFNESIMSSYSTTCCFTVRDERDEEDLWMMKEALMAQFDKELNEKCFDGMGSFNLKMLIKKLMTLWQTQQKY